MREVLQRLFQLVRVLFNRAIGSKEVLPHVVVNTYDLQVLLMEESRGLATNQSG